jgi:DNA-binding transcriptional regulator YiaG
MKLKQIVEEQMSGIRKNIWKHLKDRVFREAYVEEHVRAGVAYQIKAMREARGWSQAQFAEKCGKSQSKIPIMENSVFRLFWKWHTLLMFGFRWSSCHSEKAFHELPTDQRQY